MLKITTNNVNKNSLQADCMLYHSADPTSSGISLYFEDRNSHTVCMGPQKFYFFGILKDEAGQNHFHMFSAQVTLF